MKHFKLLLSVFVLLAGLGAAQAEKTWKVVSGSTSMFFLDSILQAHGFSVNHLNQTSHGYLMENSVAFAVQPDSTQQAASQDGIFNRFLGGVITNKGGFDLRYQPQNITMSMQNFKLKFLGPQLDQGAILYAGNDPNTPFKLFVKEFSVRLDPEVSRLDIGSGDIRISSEFAARVGRPELAGLLIGVISVRANVELQGSTGYDKEWRDPIPAGVIDLGLIAMGSLTSAGRVGAFPNGTNGLTMSTTSCNRGTQDVVWNAPMAVNHPMISMNVYRIRNGRFEQIGNSWLKHGFLATNNTDPGCGTCNNPGTGALLGPGCTDTYGTGNNSDRRYLGDPKETNPFTGIWTCVSSWFSNYVADCTRRNDGSGLDAIAHRILVTDADLQAANSEFYYEAWYINQGETNHYNQIGYRKATPTWNGSSWAFTTNTNMTLGPAINVWGDQRSTAQPRTEGDVIVAVKTTSLGNGNYHYEYAVYALNFDRQVRQFTIPIENGVSVSNIGFRDTDSDASNDWSSSFANGMVTWQTQTFAQNPNANSLKYSHTYNFWFDANTPAQPNTSVVLNLFKPGTLTDLTATINGPGPAPINLSGRAELEGWIGPNPRAPINLEFKPVAGGASTFYNNITVDGQWNFTIQTALRGEFEVYAHASHFLTKKLPGTITITSSDMGGVNMVLLAGDVNNNNEIEIADYSIFSYAFNTFLGDFNYYAPADFNGDQAVDIGDYALLAKNYGLFGD